MSSSRTLMLGPLHDAVVSQVVAQLLLLEREDPTAEIRLLINSPGGSIEAGLALYDVLKGLQCPLRTVCLGQAVGVAALLVAAGNPGRREAAPQARIVFSKASGSTVDLERLRQQHELARLLAACTGQSVEQVSDDLAHERAFDAAEARDHGLVDQVTPGK